MGSCRADPRRGLAAIGLTTPSSLVRTGLVSRISKQPTTQDSGIGVGIVGMRIVRSEGYAAFCGADEIHHLDYFRSQDSGFFEALDCELQILAGAEENCKSLAQCLNRLGRDACSLQPY